MGLSRISVLIWFRLRGFGLETPKGSRGPQDFSHETAKPNHGKNDTRLGFDVLVLGFDVLKPGFAVARLSTRLLHQNSEAQRGAGGEKKIMLVRLHSFDAKVS